MKDEEARRLGTNVSTAIARSGMELAAVAKAIGLPSTDGPARIERGDLSIPQLVRVGGLLGVPAAELATGVAS